MGNAYIGMEPQNPFYQEVRTKYVASSGQTLFTGLTYKPGYIDVYVNGSKLVEGVDFTALNGNSVTLATALNNNDDVEIQTRVPTQIVDVLNHETGVPRAELASNAGAGLVGYQAPGGIVRDVAGKLGESVSVSDYGLTTSGVIAALQQTSGAGVKVNGQEVSSSTTIDPGSGGSVVLEGQNLNSAIRKTAGTSAGPVYAFLGRTKLFLKNLKLWLDADPGATNSANLFNWDHSSIKIENVEADGGVIIDGAGNRNTANNIALVPNSGEVSGFSITNSKFTRFFWGFLKSNTAASIQKDINVSFNEFDEMGSVCMLFNSPAPGSKIENVQVIGNKLGSVLSRQPFGSPIGFPHRGSFAGYVEYSRLIGNHATGYGSEFFRAEEAAKASVWLGNTAKLDGKDGIEIIPNNVGGTLHTPTLFAIADNVLENVGLVAAPTLGWGIGLHVYTSVAGLKDAECIGESTIHNNISKGWAQALQVHQGGYRNLIHHNVLVDSEDGIKTWAPSIGISENLISDCATAIDFEGGGVLGRVHFRSASGTPSAQVIETGNGAGAVTGWTWETGKITLANGSNYFELVELGNRIDAEVVVSVARDVSNSSLTIGRLSYDGTTLTFHRTTTVGVGGQLLSSSSPFGIKNGNLAMHVFNGSGGSAPNVRISVALSGIHIWS